MRARPLLVSIFAVALGTSALAQVANIGPGSPAPELSVKRWLKGTPVTKLDPNKTYVVEFWATWCGPCIQTIPHLTDLAKKNPDVTFMGISIWEDDGDHIPAFIKKMGDKMDYNVGYSGNEEGMAQTWMVAAARNGIPSAFIVKGGQVMWIGHPAKMDEPLAKIKAGTFNVAEFKKSYDTQAEKTRKEMALNKALKAADADFELGKRAEAKAALDKLVAENPQLQNTAERIRFSWLAIENPQAWEAKAQEMVNSGDNKQVQQVATFAVLNAEKKGGAPASRKAIAMVLKAKPDDFTFLQYGRAVYTETGDTKLQLDMTKRLLAALPNSPAKDNADFKETLEKERAELEAKLAQSGK